MPVEKERYPDNWSVIAYGVKQQADWHCQGCGRACRRPHESLSTFITRVLGETDAAAIMAHPQRWTLTVAHLDQDPSNNAPHNLRALCTGCHLNHDRPFQSMNHYAKLERHGQFNLLQEGQP